MLEQEAAKRNMQSPLPGQAQDTTFEKSAQQLLSRLVLGQTIALVLFMLITATAAVINPASGLQFLLAVEPVVVLLGFLAYYWVQHGRPNLGANVFVHSTILIVAANVFLRGFQDVSAAFVLWPLLIALLILPGRAAVAAIAATVIFYGLSIGTQLAGRMPPYPFDYQREAVTTVGSLTVVVALLGFLSWAASQTLRRALAQANQATDQAREINDTLEKRVAERTAELEKATAQLLTQTDQLRASAEVSQAIASTLDVQTLLSQVTQLLADRFAFDYASIYLLEEDGKQAALRVDYIRAAGEAQHPGTRVAVGARNFVGHVLATGQSRSAGSLVTDPLYSTPPRPGIISEVTLPLRLGDRVIGALDLSGLRARSFATTDVAALSGLADQIAVALQNAQSFERQVALSEENKKSLERQTALAEENRQLLQRTQRAMDEASALNRRLTRQGWAEYAQRSASRQEQAAQPGVTATGMPVVLDEAAKRGELATGRTETGQAIAVPITLRGEVIGSLAVEECDKPGEWTADEIAILRDVSEHIALALENARLIEQTQAALAATQRAAERDARLAAINDRLHATADVRVILQSAADELLGLTGRGHAFVWVPGKKEESVVSG